jgi:signal transduction histidine kinase
MPPNEPMYLKASRRIRAAYHRLVDREALLSEAKKQLAAATELHNANRLATIGTLTAGMAHEFGTPLGVVLARAQLILSADAGPEEVARFVPAARSFGNRFRA